VCLSWHLYDERLFDVCVRNVYLVHMGPILIWFISVWSCMMTVYLVYMYGVFVRTHVFSVTTVIETDWSVFGTFKSRSISLRILFM
jgi:hypothetical protein